MIAALAWLAGSSWGRYAALGILFAAAAGLLLWRIFSAGKTAARAETLERTIHALTTRIATDQSLRALAPAARRERLRGWGWASNP